MKRGIPVISLGMGIKKLNFESLEIWKLLFSHLDDGLAIYRILTSK